jgi:transcriptional regulator with XRE-family HTH domain
MLKMKENTGTRLKKIMEERNLKQVDILNLSLPYCSKYNVKMNKSDISQYVSGKVEPSQEKLVILGMALNVSEGWLMGLDVSPLRKDTPNEASEDSDLLFKISLLDRKDRETISDMVDLMLSRKEKR